MDWQVGFKTKTTLLQSFVADSTFQIKIARDEDPKGKTDPISTLDYCDLMYDKPKSSSNLFRTCPSFTHLTRQVIYPGVVGFVYITIK